MGEVRVWALSLPDIQLPWHSTGPEQQAPSRLRWQQGSRDGVEVLGDRQVVAGMMFSLRKASVKYLLIFILLHLKKTAKKPGIEISPSKERGKGLLGKNGFTAGNSLCLHFCSGHGKG